MRKPVSSVLLIEDNPGDARLVREHLRDRFGTSCTLHEVTSLKAGLRWLDTESTDVVLLDLSLPDSRGLDTFHAVHAHAPDVPVVILSGHDDEDFALDAVRAGAEDYLAKQHADGVALARSMRHAVERRKLDRAQLEARVAERTAALEAANVELALFNRSVAHDLKAPLNAIVGFATLLEQDPSMAQSNKAMKHLSMVQRGALEMGELVSAMLALSQVERTQFRREPMDLTAMAAVVVAQLRAAEPGRAVQVDIDEGLQATGDPALVRDVLGNLLGNAWKYTRHAQAPRIHFSAARNAAGETVFAVEDNGVGFDMAAVDRLFQPFSRLASSAGFEGSGIGLATVQRIVRRHQGRIWADSRPGERTSFFFTLDGPCAS